MGLRTRAYSAYISDDETDVGRINRMIQRKYPGSDIRVSEGEYRHAHEFAQQFLKDQRGDGDTSHLNLEGGAKMTLYPLEARGKFAVNIGNEGVFGRVEPSPARFYEAQKKSYDPRWLDVQISQRQELRNQRLAIPCDKSAKYTADNYFDAVWHQRQAEKAAEQEQKQKPEAIKCHQ